MATGYVLPTPIFTGFDNNGLTAPSGRVEVYLTGTANHATTYADQALTVPNAWPVVLDAAGRANIFVPDASVAMFDVTLKTAAGVVLWSALGISIPVIPAAATAVNVPTGAILLFGGLAVPTGYLLCNGQAPLRSAFAALFGAIGIAYGNGDGSTTFNVPDLRQRFPMGTAASGIGSTHGGTGGLITHVHSFPVHTHALPTHTHPMLHTHTVPRDGWGSVLNTPGVTGRVQTGNAAGAGADASEYQATLDTTTVGSPSATNTDVSTLVLTGNNPAGVNTGGADPPFQTVNYIIKT